MAVTPSGVVVNLSEEEIKMVIERLGREPNPVEWGMIDVMWSEHCSYKSSKKVLRNLPTFAKHVILGPGYDAGVVEFDEQYAIAFKVESHNHPSAIEPYGGAATGVGGILRDILAVGAKPIALLDSLHFGPLEDERSRYLFEQVVRGIADYGNRVGVPTVAGEVEFEECFKRTPLVNVMCVGLARKDRIFKAEATRPGDLIIVFGGRTGRDGIHGVTFASEELREESEIESRPAVQIGDPFTKKLVIEATLELFETGYVRGVKDLGGGGLTCACCECAHKGGTGVEIYLDRVPLREEGMTPYEILLSESQERMFLIVDPKGLDVVRRVMEKYDLEWAVIGKVTDTGEVVAYYRGEVVARLPASLLAEGPTLDRESRKPDYLDEIQKLEHPPMPRDLSRVLLDLLASPNISSKEWVYRQYDHEVQIRTVVKPGDDAAVLRITNDWGIAVKIDGYARYVYLDPYTGGANVVAEAVRNVVSMGARPLGATDCLNWGNPEKPDVFWTFEQAVRGMADMLRALGVPIVGGNVSFYNEWEGRAIWPSPIVGIVGKVRLDRITTLDLKRDGDVIILLGETRAEMGGSEYYAKIFGLVRGKPPDARFDLEKKVHDTFLRLAESGLVTAAHDCSRGGLGIAIAEMCIASELGARIDLRPLCEKLRFDHALFSESQARIVLTVRERDLDEVLDRIRAIPHMVLGRVEDSGRLEIIGSDSRLSLDLDSMKKAYFETIPRAMEG